MILWLVCLLFDNCCCLWEYFSVVWNDSEDGSEYRIIVLNPLCVHEREKIKMIKSWFGRVLQWERVQYQQVLKETWKKIQTLLKVLPKLVGFWQNLTSCSAVCLYSIIKVYNI